MHMHPSVLKLPSASKLSDVASERGRKHPFATGQSVPCSAMCGV